MLWFPDHTECDSEGDGQRPVQRTVLAEPFSGRAPDLADVLRDYWLNE